MLRCLRNFLENPKGIAKFKEDYICFGVKQTGKQVVAIKMCTQVDGDDEYYNMCEFFFFLTAEGSYGIQLHLYTLTRPSATPFAPLPQLG